jgi:nanoRNase/pAp phosphatase (c-di-AMP/oligoRNAs hydrolase)
MSHYKEAEAIKQAIDEAAKIVIVQADNPDGDSLASALTLEEILSDIVLRRRYSFLFAIYAR